MTDTDVQHPPRQSAPVEVVVKNWTDKEVKPRLVKNTTMTTYVVDGTDVNKKIIQICGYEPHRFRVIVQAVDHEVGITTEVPKANEVPLSASPIVGYSAVRYLPPQGANASNEYVFFGPDAMWLVALGSTGRVTVTKEYC